MLPHQQAPFTRQRTLAKRKDPVSGLRLWATTAAQQWGHGTAEEIEHFLGVLRAQQGRRPEGRPSSWGQSVPARSGSPQ